MTMITPSAQLTLTKGNKSWVPGPPSSQLLGYLDKGKRKRKEKAGSLQWAYMAIARLGGFMDSKRTGIASWGALW